MTTVTLELPTELVSLIEHVADETGQSLETLIADVLTARFVEAVVPTPSGTRRPSGRIRLRPVALANWQPETTFRREEIYGDDAR